MKPELMAEYMRKRREKLKEANAQVTVNATVNTQPEPKKEEKVNGSPPVEKVATPKLDYGEGLIIHPDKFKGMHEPEYYQTCCIYCGNPKTTLVKRNGFLGHLCETHNPNILPIELK